MKRSTKNLRPLSTGNGDAICPEKQPLGSDTSLVTSASAPLDSQRQLPVAAELLPQSTGMPLFAGNAPPLWTSLRVQKSSDEWLKYFDDCGNHLRQRCKELNNIAESVLNFETSPERLRRDISFILQMLEETLDELIPVGDPHTCWSLGSQYLYCLADVVDVMQTRKSWPLLSSDLRKIALVLARISDSEECYTEEARTSRYWAESDLAEDGLAPLIKAVNALSALETLPVPAARSLRLPSFCHEGKEHEYFVCSDDFRSMAVKGHSEPFVFTPVQAGAIKELVRAFRQGGLAISDATIIDAAGGQGTRVRDLFKVSGSKYHLFWELKFIKRVSRDTSCLDFQKS